LGHLPNPEDAWRAFTRYTKITRKRYAELIAVELVREVAEAYDGREHAVSFGYSPGDGWRVTVEHGDAIAPHPLVQVDGPTLCDAAWACIQALGGGE